MRRTFQKLAAVILVLAMVFTGVSLDTTQVSAASKKPTKITLNAKSKTVTVGKTFQLKVKSVKPAKASKAVTYNVRRHITGGENCTLISAETPPRLCRTGN